MQKILALCLVLMVLLGSCKSAGKAEVNSLVESSYVSDSADVVDVPSESEEVSQQSVDEEASTEDTFPYITYEMALQDYEDLWEILELNYPHLESAEEVYQVDYANVKQNHLTMIEGYTKPIILEDYFDDLYKIIKQFKYLGHLSLMDSDYFWTMCDMYESRFDDYDSKIAAQEIESDEFEKRYMEELKNVFRNEQVLRTYTYLGEESEITESISDMDMNANENMQVEYINDDTVYISVASFMGNYVESDNEKFMEIYKTINNYDNLIIDVRGNGGGTDAYWQENIVEPNIKKKLSILHYGIGKSGGVNKYLYEHNASTVNGARRVIERLPNIDMDLLDSMEYAEISVQWFTPDVSIPSFQGEIYVLVDDGVYSATEGFVLMCKSSGFAKVVGTQTGGDGGLLKIREFALEGSGLTLRFSTMLPLNADGSPNTPYGSTPDYVLNEGDDFVEECLKIIESEGEGQ